MKENKKFIKKIIGKVELLASGESMVDDRYSDGSVEDNMLKLFKGESSTTDMENIINNNPSWPERYHLSPVRKNLLDWYDFSKEATLLEVGVGCGAVTEVFTQKLSKVVGVELSKKRAEITAERHKYRDNLTIYAGNLNDIEIDEKFDYVTSIGVLEYAGKYTHTSNPFLDFIFKMKGYLKDGGILIIAIENKFGLKYWAGAKEDHTGKFFDSIENYPSKKGVKTFGKKEISDLLYEAGFSDLKFYYPMPDYKLPIEIFSDEYLPTMNHNIRMGMFPVRDYSKEREFLFNEKLAMDNIIQNGQFDFFANSFLIFAKL
ncbi:MAG: methyltransferase domain-containing protein [Candidatus Moranbacteria bacterium]|jgi:SAM-dependent methyltransferase|nr:methyltransferase domain-containing protein [Candidatus Moranbacteria bacterium]